MTSFFAIARSRFTAIVACAALAFIVSGCATLGGSDPVRVNLVGMEPMSGEGMEMRFKVKLRVQNPNDSAIDFDGVSLDLDLNERNFATGVSDEKGSVPRFGEKVISVPVSVSAYAIVRQVLGVIGNEKTVKNVPYVMRGKLGGTMLSGMRFKEAGTIDLPAVSDNTP